MKFDLILLDVDNTLIDFDYSEKKAIEKVFFDNKITLTDEILNFYAKTNDKLWEMFEKGEVTKEFILIERFNRTFEQYGLNADAAYINHHYQIALGEFPMLFEGALEVCEKLVSMCKVAIVTNGTKIAQDKKLELTGLDKIIDAIFILEEVGYNKPDARFFETVFSKVGDYDKDKILIVGDSLTSDMKGGSNVGIKTCWINTYQQKNLSQKVDYEIGRISELLEVII